MFQCCTYYKYCACRTTWHNIAVLSSRHCTEWSTYLQDSTPAMTTYSHCRDPSVIIVSDMHGATLYSSSSLAAICTRRTELRRLRDWQTDRRNAKQSSPLEWSPVNLLIILYSVDRINWLWGGQIHNSVKLKCFVSRLNFILIYLPASKTINPCTVSECYGTLNPILPPLSWSVIHRESDGYNMRKSLSLLTYRHLTHLPAIDTVPHR